MDSQQQQQQQLSEQKITPRTFVTIDFDDNLKHSWPTYKQCSMTYVQPRPGFKESPFGIAVRTEEGCESVPKISRDDLATHISINSRKSQVYTHMNVRPLKFGPHIVANARQVTAIEEDVYRVVAVKHYASPKTSFLVTHNIVESFFEGLGSDDDEDAPLPTDAERLAILDGHPCDGYLFTLGGELQVYFPFSHRKTPRYYKHFVRSSHSQTDFDFVLELVNGELQLGISFQDCCAQIPAVLIADQGTQITRRQYIQMIGTEEENESEWYFDNGLVDPDLLEGVNRYYSIFSAITLYESQALVPFYMPTKTSAHVVYYPNRPHYTTGNYHFLAGSSPGTQSKSKRVQYQKKEFPTFVEVNSQPKQQPQQVVYVERPEKQQVESKQLKQQDQPPKQIARMEQAHDPHLLFNYKKDVKYPAYEEDVPEYKFQPSEQSTINEIVITEKHPYQKVTTIYTATGMFQTATWTVINDLIVYSPPLESKYCAYKCFALNAYRRSIPVCEYDQISKELYTLDAWRRVGQKMFTYINSSQMVTDEIFLAWCKAETVIPKPSLQLISDYAQYPHTYYTPEMSEGVIITEEGRNVHAIYIRSQQSLQYKLQREVQLLCPTSLTYFQYYMSKTSSISFLDPKCTTCYRANPTKRLFIHENFFINFQDISIALKPLKNDNNKQQQPDIKLNKVGQEPEKKQKIYSDFTISYSSDGTKQLVLPPKSGLRLSRIGANIFKEKFGTELQVNLTLPNSGQYPHGFLRLITDYLTVFSFTLLPNKFVDIASKYPKTSKMLQNAGSKQTFQPTRPPLEPYDIQYNAQYLEKWNTNNPDVQVITEPCPLESLIDQHLLIVDAVYYPGVIQQIQMQNTKTVVVCHVTPKHPGTYYYYDNEGSVVIKQQGDKLIQVNRPAGNDKEYTHSVLYVHPRSGNYYGRYWELREKVTVGPSLFACCFIIHPGQQQNDINTASFFQSLVRYKHIDNYIEWPADLRATIVRYLTSTMGTNVRFIQMCDTDIPQHIYAACLSHIGIWCQDNGYHNFAEEPTTRIEIYNLALSMTQAASTYTPSFQLYFKRFVSWMYECLDAQIETMKTQGIVGKTFTAAQQLQDYLKPKQYLVQGLDDGIVHNVQCMVFLVIEVFCLPFILGNIVPFVLSPVDYLFNISLSKFLTILSWCTTVFYTTFACLIFASFIGFRNIRIYNYPALIIASLLHYTAWLHPLLTMLVHVLIVKFSKPIQINLTTVLMYLTNGLDTKLIQLLNRHSSRQVRGFFMYYTRFCILFFLCLEIITYALIIYFFYRIIVWMKKLQILEEAANDDSGELRDFDKDTYLFKFMEAANVPQLVRRQMLKYMKFVEWWTIEKLTLFVFVFSFLSGLISFPLSAMFTALLILIGRSDELFHQTLYQRTYQPQRHDQLIAAQSLWRVYFKMSLIDLLVDALIPQKEAEEILQRVMTTDLLKDKSIEQTLYQTATSGVIFRSQQKWIAKFLTMSTHDLYMKYQTLLTVIRRAWKRIIINLKMDDQIQPTVNFEVNGYQVRNDFFVEPDPSLVSQLDESIAAVASGTRRIKLNRGCEKILRQQLKDSKYQSQKHDSSRQPTVLSCQTDMMPNQTAVCSSQIAAAVAFFVRHATFKVDIIRKGNTHINQIKELVLKSQIWQNLIDINLPTFSEYLDTVEPKKRHAYQLGMNYFTNSDKIQVSFKVMQKANEKQIGTAKPRNLFNPSDSIKGVMGYISHCLIKSCKQGLASKSFCPGKQPEQLEEELTQWVASRKIWSVSTDCTSFDAHQSIELIEAIDHTYLRKALPILLDRLSITGIKAQQIIKLATASKLPYTFSDRGARRPVKGYICGTVFSGHPLRTTLGNTLRMMFINCYLNGSDLRILRGEHPSIRIGHQGDDQFTLFTSEQECNRYTETLKVLFNIESGENAFGLCFKSVDVQVNQFNFISKIYYTYPYVKGVKLPEKAILLGRNLVDCQDLPSALTSIRGELKTYSNVTGLASIPLPDLPDSDQKSYKQDYVIGQSKTAYYCAPRELLSLSVFPQDYKLSRAS